MSSRGRSPDRSRAATPDMSLSPAQESLSLAESSTSFTVGQLVDVEKFPKSVRGPPGQRQFGQRQFAASKARKMGHSSSKK